MSWKAVPNGSEIDLVGPAGTTLTVTMSSTSDDHEWDGWTWSGKVRATPDSSTVLATFTFSDSSTATELAATAEVAAATTAAWTPGDTLSYGISGTKNGVVVNVATGRIIPTWWVDR